MDKWLGTHFQSTQEDEEGMIFPYALKCPGALHMIDNVLQEATYDFNFWTEWNSNSKLCLQLLHSSRRTEKMVSLLREARLHVADLEQLVKS